MKSETQKPVDQLTDEELFDELREQVNRGRFDGMHDRKRTRDIAAECKRRNWNLRPPSKP